MKSCDRGQHFHARGHSFSRTDPRPANSMFIFFSCSKWLGGKRGAGVPGYGVRGPGWKTRGLVENAGSQ